MKILVFQNQCNHQICTRVDLDEYIGPTWDKNNKTHVPIPLFDVPCDRRDANCCTMKSIPLDLSFARTLHKFQGKAVGPDHPMKYMIFEPGTSTFEGNNPGLLYTGLSRATTLGNGNINESALYLTGTNANEDRFCNLVHYWQKHKKNEIISTRIRRNSNWYGQLVKQKTWDIHERTWWHHYLSQHTFLIKC